MVVDGPVVILWASAKATEQGRASREKQKLIASLELKHYNPPAMFPVYQAKDLIEAELLLQRLQDRSIPSALQNAFLIGLLGELPLTTRPTVCVLEERDASAALVCIREMEAALRAPELPELVCPSCGDTSPGNFEECWKCRTALTS